LEAWGYNTGRPVNRMPEEDSMHPIARFPVVTAALLALALPLAFGACSGEDEKAAAEAERESRLAEIEEQKQALDTARSELETTAERLSQAESGALPAGEEVDAAELRAEIERADAEITTAAENLNAALTNFINEVAQQASIGPGEPLPEVLQRAIALKAEEDMTLAREFITEGGDYVRALDMYGAILAYDPENQRVRDAIAEAQAMRYMDQERFSQVRNGMTPAEVEQLLGTVNLRNRREYPDQGIMAWYYPKSAARNAAGVWFRQRGNRWEVYRIEFDAVGAQGQDGS